MKGVSKDFKFDLQLLADNDNQPAAEPVPDSEPSPEPQPTQDNQPNTTQPVNDNQPEPVQTAQPVAGDDMTLVQGLYQLLQTTPALADKIADVIEDYFSGGAQDKQPLASAENNQLPASAETAGAEELRTLLTTLDGRLSRLEKTHANEAIERELSEARREYDNMKNHFPILPDLNDNELLQIALQYDGLPLKEALNLWVMRKLQEGEGTVADRITAAKMEQSKAQNLPRVEGKGGGIPTGNQEPPRNFREARRRAREYLASIVGGPTNV